MESPLIKLNKLPDSKIAKVSSGETGAGFGDVPEDAESPLHPFERGITRKRSGHRIFHFDLFITKSNPSSDKNPLLQQVQIRRLLQGTHRTSLVKSFPLKYSPIDQVPEAAYPTCLCAALCVSSGMMTCAAARLRRSSVTDSLTQG